MFYMALILMNAEGNCCLWISCINKWPLNLCALSFIYHSPYNDDTLRDVFQKWVSLKRPWSEGKCALSHDEACRRSGKMKGTALSGGFCWNFETPAFWQVAKWRNSSGYAFGLSLGLWSFEFRAVFWPVGFPGFWPCGFPPRNKAGLPNFGSCWQRFKQRTICGGCLGPQNLATSKNDPSGLYNTFWTTTYTVVKVDGSTLKRWRFVGGHDKSRLMGVASHLVSRWYSWFSN